MMKFNKNISNKTKIIVAGPRDFNDEQVVFEYLDNLLKDRLETIQIVEGGATGVDLLAKKWAISRHVPYMETKAEWTKYGKAAGPVRNEKMADISSELIAFYCGSKGTENMIKTAQRRGLKVEIVEIQKDS